MKRKILAVLLMFSMFLSGFMSVNALTTGNEDTDYIIVDPDTRVSVYGRHYTIRDYNGGLIHSFSSGFNGDQPTGVFRYFDSNGASIFCGQLGKRYVANKTHTGTPTTYTGTGPACGILLSLNAGINSDNANNKATIGESDGTNIIGQEQSVKLNIQLSYFDSNSNSHYSKNDASYISIQRAIWKYQNYTGTCPGNVKDYKVITDAKDATLTIPTASTMKLSANGEYYESTLDIAIANESNLVGNITYASTNNKVVVERINNKQIRVKVKIADYENGMKVVLNATGKSKDYTYISYVPVVTMHDMGTASDGSEAQDMATVSLTNTSGTVEKALSASSTVTLTVPNGSIEVLKTNSVNSTPVEGAKFNLYVKKDGKYIDATYLNGTKVGNLTTDKTGKILINNLPYGEYKIKETGAAPGYVYDEKNHLEREIVIDAKASNYTGTKAIKITNDPIKVVISKKDVAKEGEIEGAKIAIYNYDETKKEKGEKVIEFTSKKEPFEYYLEPGVYALEETLAPASYQKLETTFVFEVEVDGDVKLLDTYSDKNILVKNNKITIYNEVVVVPDTGSSSNIIYIVIGSILLLAGSGLIYLTIKKRKTESI